MEKLEWLPLYIDKLLSSPAWKDMKDYQRGWYIELLLRCTRSERLGYLKMDGNLWRIAGAHSQPMWDAHKGAVMACFKIRHDDETSWLYNDRLLSVMEDQSQKYLRRSSANDASLSPALNRVKNSESKAKPRSIEEVRSYCDKRNNAVSAEGWWDFYESKGWKIGRNTMKDWKASVRTWERRNGDGNGTKPAVSVNHCEKCMDAGTLVNGDACTCERGKQAVVARQVMQKVKAMGK